MRTCSFVSCINSEISNSQDYCEIRTVIPKSCRKETSTVSRLRKQFIVKWNGKGEATLHTNCWDDVLKASRKRSRTKQKSGVNVVDEEKLLIKEAAKTVEFFNSREKIKKVANQVADLIKKSEHFVCFTGAGISTSAGIGDYRGKSGKWTQQDQLQYVETVEAMLNPSNSEESPAKKQKLSDEEDDKDDDDDGVSYEDLRPTYTHEALQLLMEDGFLKYVISQNGDGLHTLSKIPLEKISELHGNVFIERCEKCKTRYEQPFYVMDDESSQYFEDLEEFGSTDIKKSAHAKKCDLCGLNHRTGRKCQKKGCKGYLIDTIINFRDNLEDEVYERAVENAEKSDLMLCLGTTLLVTPANELVEMTRDPQCIVICNRQKTPLDYMYKNGDCKGYRVYGDCDIFMKELMANILPEDRRLQWEEERGERMLFYDKQRGQK